MERIEGWQQKMLHFVRQPASAAIRDHNRYSLKPIVLLSAEKGDIPVTGRVPIGDSVEFARRVAEAIDAEVRVEDDRIVLR